MKTVSIRKASRSLGQYASELKDDIVVVTKGRRPVAALVPLKNVDRESLALSSSPEFLEIIRRSRAEIASGKALSLAEVKALVLGMQPRNTRVRRATSRRRGRAAS